MNKENFFRLHSIIFLAMIVGMVAFLVFAYLQTKDTQYLLLDFNDPFMFIAPAALLGGITAGNFIFKTLIAKGIEGKQLNEKLTVYTSVTIIKYALTEGPVLIATVGYFMSGNQVFALLAIVGILYFFTLKLNPEKVARALNLSYDERNDLGIK